MQRLSIDACPACESENPPDARYCGGCGSPLIRRCDPCGAMNVRTRVACHRCGAHLVKLPEPQRDTISGVSSEAAGPVVPVLGDDAAATVDADWTLSLRVGALTPPVAAPDASLPHADEATSPMPADPDAPGQMPAELPAGAPAAKGPAASPAQRQNAKAERRASVRRARLRRETAEMTEDPAARDILLLEPDTDSRTAIALILEDFGFRTHVAVSVAEAEGLAVRQPYAAAFLGLGTDVNAAANLCRQLRDVPRGRPLAIVAIGAADRHTDRVRMQLAGAETNLFRPVSRGDLARVLDACGLVMPRDPRRGASQDT